MNTYDRARGIIDRNKEAVRLVAEALLEEGSRQKAALRAAFCFGYRGIRSADCGTAAPYLRASRLSISAIASRI